MELKPSLIASQHTTVSNSVVREPQKESAARQQQQQKQVADLLNTQVVIRPGGTEAFEQAERFRQKHSFQERTDARSRQAIDTYQSLLKEDKRMEMQQLMGVDTYA